MKRKVLKSMIIALLLIFISYMGVITFVYGAFQQNTYQRPYDETYATSFTDKRLQVIALGMLAPNSHNMQPWAIELDEQDPSRFLLYINTDRVLPVVDENYNQMMMSCGTFIGYMLEGASTIGYTVTYELFPEGVLSEIPELSELHNTPIAEIKILESTSQTESYEFDTFAGATNRTPYTNETIPTDVLDQINMEQYTSVRIDFLMDNLEDFKTLLISGVEIESQYKEAMIETSNVFRYLKKDKNNTPFGLTLHSSNTSSFTVANIGTLGSLFPVGWEKEGEVWLKNETLNIQSSSSFGLIFGDGTRESQIQTGIVFSLLQLQLLDSGIHIQPLVQVTQGYDLMKDLNTQVNNTYSMENETIYMIFRMGYTYQNVLQGIRFDVSDIVR